MSEFVVFPFFAEGIRPRKNGLDIIGMRICMPAVWLESHSAGSFWYDVTLFVHVAADMGRHILDVSHGDTGWRESQIFDIAPSDSTGRTIVVADRVPVSLSEKSRSSVYELRLDGDPAGTIRLMRVAA